MANQNPKTASICREIMTTCAVTHLRRLTRLTTNQFNDKIKPTGLRHTQVCVMMVIGIEPGKTLTTYASDLGMDLSTLARSIETLEKGGYVRLESGKRRERLAHLSAEGEDKLAEVYPLWLEAQNQFVDAFGAEHWEGYLSAASKHTS